MKKKVPPTPRTTGPQPEGWIPGKKNREALMRKDAEISTRHPAYKDSFEYDEENWGNVVSVKELQEQIEKLKCCGNCKHYASLYASDYYGDEVYGCDHPTKSSVRIECMTAPSFFCKDWEMKE